MSRRLTALMLGALALGTLTTTNTAQAGEASGSSISLSQTVMIDNGNDECAVTNSITVPAGTTVRFCYVVTNTGSTTLNLHTVFGSFDGAVYTNFPFNLPPLSSTFVTSTEVVNVTTTNNGTWIATNSSNNDMAQGQAAATVNVLGTQHTATGSVSAVVTESSTCSLNITVTVSDEGDDDATFIVQNTGRPAGVAPPTVVTYIGFGEGSFQFNDFPIGLGDSLNGTYTFTVTKLNGDGTVGITNPVTVSVEVNDLRFCGQHSASVSITSSSACDLDLNLLVDDGTDDAAVFTVRNTGKPIGVGFSDAIAYVGYGEGGFAFNNFDVGPGGSLNGTYTFTVDKTSGDAIGSIEDPITISYEVSGLPTCGARVIIEKTTIGDAGGPFDFEVLDEDEMVVASPSGSTSSADTPTLIYEDYLPAGFYSVTELFGMGDPGDPDTWNAGDGFFPGTMTCTLTEADEEVSTNDAEPTSLGVTGIGFQVGNGEVMRCVVENIAPASISIAKNTPGDEASPTFSFTGDLQVQLAGGESATFGGLQPGTYTITEAELDGWTLTSIGCEGGDATVDLATRTLIVEVGPGESAECEFVNFEDEVPPTTDDSGSGGGAPTTTNPRGLPQTGGGSSSNTLAVLAIGLVFAGTALLAARRRATR